MADDLSARIHSVGREIGSDLATWRSTFGVAYPEEQADAMMAKMLAEAERKIAKTFAKPIVRRLMAEVKRVYEEQMSAAAFKGN